MTALFRYCGLAVLSGLLGFGIGRMSVNDSADVQSQSDKGSAIMEFDEFDSYGTPLDLSSDVDADWKGFAHEFDWKVKGGTRVRFDTDSGSPEWGTVIRMPLQDAVKAAKMLNSWRRLVTDLENRGDSYSSELIANALSTRSDWMQYELSELDMLPFIVLDLHGEDVESILARYPGQSIYTSDAQAEIEKLLSRHGVELDLNWRESAF